MKVLLDECVNWRLLRFLVGHEVITARQMGWSEIQNGKLLSLASTEFDVMITMDKNMSYQNEIKDFSIGLVVLHTRQTKIAMLEQLAPKVLEAIQNSKLGQITNVYSD